MKITQNVGRFHHMDACRCDGTRNCYKNEGTIEPFEWQMNHHFAWQYRAINHFYDSLMSNRFHGVKIMIDHASSSLGSYRRERVKCWIASLPHRTPWRNEWRCGARGNCWIPNSEFSVNQTFVALAIPAKLLKFPSTRNDRCSWNRKITHSTTIHRQ